MKSQSRSSTRHAFSLSRLVRSSVRPSIWSWQAVVRGSQRSFTIYPALPPLLLHRACRAARERAGFSALKPHRPSGFSGDSRGVGRPWKVAALSAECASLHKRSVASARFCRGSCGQRRAKGSECTSQRAIDSGGDEHILKESRAVTSTAMASDIINLPKGSADVIEGEMRLLAIRERFAAARYLLPLRRLIAGSSRNYRKTFYRGQRDEHRSYSAYVRSECLRRKPATAASGGPSIFFRPPLPLDAIPKRPFM